MIYFIITEDRKFVKIGFTKKNLKNRINAIQTGCPLKIKCSLLLEGDKTKETELHIKFNSFKSYGEWFYLTEEIEEFIKDNEHLDLKDIRKTNKPGKPSKYTDEQKNIMLKQYQEKVTLVEIAENMNITIKAAYRVIQRMGGIRPNQKRRKKSSSNDIGLN